MKIGWKIWLLVAVVIVVAIAISSIVIYQGLKTASPIKEEKRETQSQNLPNIFSKPVTDNIDDAVETILSEISEEEKSFDEALKDADLVASDSQAISDFGQSYDEKEF